MAWMMLGFFVFMTFVFMVFAVFFPEWIGITGQKAMEIQKEHLQENLASSSTEDQKDPTDANKAPSKGP